MARTGPWVVGREWEMAVVSDVVLGVRAFCESTGELGDGAESSWGAEGMTTMWDGQGFQGSFTN